MTALRFWNVPVYGFDDVVAVAPTRDKARWAAFTAGKEAGYYDERGGFSRFLADVGNIRSMLIDEARARLGGHIPAGAPRGWQWP